MRLEDFDYELPEELIAQEPPAERDGARMLVLDRAKNSWEDRTFRDLPEYLGPGDCLVLNDSRVFPSRLFGRRLNGGAVEVLLLRATGERADEWTALVRPGRKLPVGEAIQFENGLIAEIIERRELGERMLRFRGANDIRSQIEQIGHVPLPPYIKRPDTEADRERYQTIYARESGSVAAPTAGLHFTDTTLSQCHAAGATSVRVTLHVGLGTFQPLQAAALESRKLHAERYSMAPEAWRQIGLAKRVIGVGSTSVRTVESAARTGQLDGDTDLMIAPPFEFLRTGAMLTNFHLPRTSLLLLVCALAGTDRVLAAYRHAVEARYRFFSYGDCMLIL